MTNKILLVDENSANRSLVSNLFSGFNCQTLQAEHGAEALEIAERERPDLIIMDVLMNVMDGKEALSRLKGTPSLKDIPVIMLTDESELDEKIRLLRLGASDYMTKSFDPEELLENVRDFIDLQVKEEAVA